MTTQCDSEVGNSNERLSLLTPAPSGSRRLLRLMCRDPASACRPRSVIASQVTVTCRPPGLHRGPRRRGREPVQHQVAKVSTVKPCANMIASVAPFGEPASSLSALFCSAPRPPLVSAPLGLSRSRRCHETRAWTSHSAVPCGRKAPHERRRGGRPGVRWRGAAVDPPKTRRV
jgi:hypothetical protein